MALPTIPGALSWTTDFSLLPLCLRFSPSLQVTVCWVEEALGRHTQSLSPQAEHAGIRTYFFSAENTEEQESWIQAMGEAARVQIPPPQRSARQAPYAVQQWPKTLGLFGELGGGCPGSSWGHIGGYSGY